MKYSITVYVDGQTEGATLSILLGRSPVDSYEFMCVGEHVIDCDVYEVKDEDLETEVNLIYALSHLFPLIRYNVREDACLIEGPGPLLNSSLYINFPLSDKWSVKDDLKQAYEHGTNCYSMDLRCNLDVVYTSLVRTRFFPMAQEAMYLEQDIRIHEEKADADTNPLVSFYHYLYQQREDARKQPASAENRQKLIVMTAVLKLCKEHLDDSEEVY